MGSQKPSEGGGRWLVPCLSVSTHGSSLKKSSLKLIVTGTRCSLLLSVMKTYVSKGLSKRDPGVLGEVKDAAITLHQPILHISNVAGVTAALSESGAGSKARAGTTLITSARAADDLANRGEEGGGSVGGNFPFSPRSKSDGEGRVWDECGECFSSLFAVRLDQQFTKGHGR